MLEGPYPPGPTRGAEDQRPELQEDTRLGHPVQAAAGHSTGSPPSSTVGEGPAACEPVEPQPGLCRALGRSPGPGGHRSPELTSGAQ